MQNEIKENIMSALRPAWTQNDWGAFNHLHLTKTTVKDHFAKSKGFASKRDLVLVEGGSNGRN